MAIIPSNIFVGPYDPFCQDIWDPFQEFGYGGPLIAIPHTYPNEATSFMNSMKFDWQETPDGKFLLKAEIPGFKKEQVKVDLEEGRVLHIKGEKSVEKKENSDRWQRVERSSGKFSRRLMLPENAVANKMKVSMENGMLNVTFPKENVKKHSPKTRVIQIAGH